VVVIGARIASEADREAIQHIFGTKGLTMEVTMLLDLIISRCRASVHADEVVKELVRGALEATKQEIAHLEELVEESEPGSGRSQKVRRQRIREQKLEAQERGPA
jgi:hypothetical protein